MNEAVLTATEAILSMLAPALAISADALLLLSMQNRYSLIIARIRQLNAEKRQYSLETLEKGGLPDPEAVRLQSVLKQLEILLLRGRYIRNTISLIQLSILLFILTSGAIGLNLLVGGTFLLLLPLILFVGGMGLIFAAVLFSFSEVRRAYSVIEFEVKSEE